MMARTIKLDAAQLMRKMTIVVTIKKQREMRIRLWIATRLIKLAGLVTGMGIEFKDGEEQQEVNDGQED
jgi:hypothetical protein